MAKKYILFIFLALVLIGVTTWTIFYFRRSESSPDTTSPTPTRSGFAPMPQGDQEVLIKDYTFQPERLRVLKGQKVTWRNMDTVSHTVSAVILGGQHVLEPGASFTFSTDQLPFDGEITYTCDFHRGMQGVLAVISSDKPLPDFAKLYFGLQKEKQSCIENVFGSRLPGFLDGTIANSTREELEGLTACLK